MDVMKRTAKNRTLTRHTQQMINNQHSLTHTLSHVLGCTQTHSQRWLLLLDSKFEHTKRDNTKCNSVLVLFGAQQSAHSLSWFRCIRCCGRIVQTERQLHANLCHARTLISCVASSPSDSFFLFQFYSTVKM